MWGVCVSFFMYESDREGGVRVGPAEYYHGTDISMAEDIRLHSIQSIKLRLSSSLRKMYVLYFPFSWNGLF